MYYTQKYAIKVRQRCLLTYSCTYLELFNYKPSIYSLVILLLVQGLDLSAGVSNIIITGTVDDFRILL